MSIYSTLDSLGTSISSYILTTSSHLFLANIISSLALIIAEFTPIFKILGLPFIPVLELLQVPQAKEAAQKAIQSPLLEAQISGAKNAIVNITGGPAITIADSAIAVDYIREAAGSDLNIIYGVAINEAIGENIIVTVIATGFEETDNQIIQSTSPMMKPKAKVVQKQEPVRQAPVYEEEDDDDEDGAVPVFLQSRNI